MLEEKETRKKQPGLSGGGAQSVSAVRSYWGWGYEAEHSAIRHSSAGMWSLLQSALQLSETDGEEIVPPSLEQISNTLREPRKTPQDLPQHLQGLCTSASWDR